MRQKRHWQQWRPTKKEYREYLQSKRWLEIKQRLYSLFDSCQLCGSKKDLNIHHITYRRLGWERDNDLIVVCHDCHINKIHSGEIPHTDLFKITGGRYSAPKLPKPDTNTEPNL